MTAEETLKTSNGVKKLLPVVIVLMIIVGGGAFYGGMKYNQSKNKGSNQGFRNLSPEQRQQLGANARGSFGPGRGNQGGANFTGGEIIAKDDKSITLKLRDGGSKIIFFSDSTEVDKFINGGTGDLEIGKTIMVNGTANQDGSITAQSIQLRPENPTTP